VHTATMTRFYPILADAQAPAPSWWFDPARGGGWLRANGTHLLDQLRLWLGEFSEVSAEIYQGVPRAAGAADDGYVLRFRTAGGAVGVLQESAAVWGQPLEVTRVAGVRGAITVDGDDCRLATADGEVELSAAAPPVAVEGSRPWTGLEVENYSRLTGWLHAMLSGAAPAGTARPATFADGLAVLRIIDAAEQSMREGRLTTVPVASNEEVPR
jgi:predicted dehydrogenase